MIVWLFQKLPIYLKKIVQNNDSEKHKFDPGSEVSTEGSDRWDTPRILSPPVTIALGILGVSVASLILWSITYRLPVYSKGHGLLFSGEKLYGIRAQSEGTVRSINVDLNSEVSQGDELANLYIEDDEANRLAASTEFESSTKNRQLADSLIPFELSRQIKSNEKLLADTTKNIQQQLIILDKQRKNLNVYAELEQKGYLSEIELLGYQEKAIQLENTIGTTESKLISLRATRDKIVRELNESLNEARSKMAADKAQLTIRRNKVNNLKKLYSPISGRVVQMTALAGNVVRNGEELFVISYPEGEMRGAFLLNSKYGGQVRVNDDVLISPSSAPAQRFGYLRGRVEKVSPYPTNVQAYTSLIGSESLAKSVYQAQRDEAATLVIARVSYDKGKPMWVGSRGPDWGIRSGTTASMKVIYEKRLPITYVVPWLKEITGIDNF